MGFYKRIDFWGKLFVKSAFSASKLRDGPLIKILRNLFVKNKCKLTLKGDS